RAPPPPRAESTTATPPNPWQQSRIEVRSPPWESWLQTEVDENPGRVASEFVARRPSIRATENPLPSANASPCRDQPGHGFQATSDVEDESTSDCVMTERGAALLPAPGRRH